MGSVKAPKVNWLMAGGVMGEPVGVLAFTTEKRNGLWCGTVAEHERRGRHGKAGGWRKASILHIEEILRLN